MLQNDKVKKILNSDQPSKTDPLGSWTGLPMDSNDQPEQDADDL